MRPGLPALQDTLEAPALQTQSTCPEEHAAAHRTLALRMHQQYYLRFSCFRIWAWDLEFRVQVGFRVSSCVLGFARCEGSCWGSCGFNGRSHDKHLHHLSLCLSKGSTRTTSMIFGSTLASVLSISRRALLCCALRLLFLMACSRPG